MVANLLTLQTVTMDWKLESFLVNLIEKVKVLGSGVIMLLGALMIIVGVWQIFKGVTGGQKAHTNWAMTLGCFIIGGMFLTGGYNLMANISKGAGSSIEEIGNKDTSGSLTKDGEKDTSTSGTTSTQTIVLPFGSATAHIDMN